jgi:hypothetical protein
MSKSQMKEILVINFFDIKSTVHFELIPQSQTCYVEILKWLPEAMRRKVPELWTKYWIFRHDNSPAHKAPSVKQFLVSVPFHFLVYLSRNCYQKIRH